LYYKNLSMIVKDTEIVCLYSSTTEEVVMFLKNPGGPIISGINFMDAKTKFEKAMNYYKVASNLINKTIFNTK